MSRLTSLINLVEEHGSRSCRANLMLPHIAVKDHTDRACQAMGYYGGFFNTCRNCAVDSKKNLTRALRALR